jgi:hypothetical protein
LLRTRKGPKRYTDTEKALGTFVKQSLSKDSPNLRRFGCFPEKTLKRQARDPQHAQESVSRHLLRCSPCYRVYQRLLRESLRTLRKIHVRPRIAKPKKN